MSIIKSFSVGNGDMFYIKHDTDSFTIIDCYLDNVYGYDIFNEIQTESKGKGIHRFISTHPDDDHIFGLAYLNNKMPIRNFYCVKNQATKEDDTDDFSEYCSLRDDTQKAFYLFSGCSRKWLNITDSERGGAGIEILWPNENNDYFKEALQSANDGNSPNNISPIVKYSLEGGATILWMGDLESDFTENIQDEITMNAIDILFAPHHGRDSGKLPEKWLKIMSPKVVIIGEAPSKDLNYYSGYNTITQNSAGHITLECLSGKVHVYVSNRNYSVDFLAQYNLPNSYGKYLGTINL
jgi:beta-lactamase superfamily II metal-dependent hydrolase